MLVTLSVVFCLIGTPHQGTNCQIIYPDALEEFQGGLTSCQLYGQLFASHWLEDHPKWELDRVQCTPGNDPRKDRNDI